MTAPSNANTSGLSEMVRVLSSHLPVPQCPDTVCLPVTVTAGDLRAIHAALVTAASAQARIAELEAERDAWKLRGDQHWETLRSIREFAREGDCERIIQWVNDAGSGHVESVEQTLGQMTDRATAAEARADRLAKVISSACDLLAERTYGNSARSPAHNARLQLEEALQQETQP